MKSDDEKKNSNLCPPVITSPTFERKHKQIYSESKSGSTVIFKRNLPSGYYSPFKPPRDINKYPVIPIRFNIPKNEA
jgi:hypothetical protein